MPGKEIKGRSKIAMYNKGGDVKGKYPSKGMNSLASERPDVAKKIMGYKNGKLVKKNFIKKYLEENSGTREQAEKQFDKRYNTKPNKNSGSSTSDIFKSYGKYDGKEIELKKGGSAKKGTYKTKDGRTVKKGLYYYMNKRKKAGTSRPGTGTVSAKALKRSAKTAKKS